MATAATAATPEDPRLGFPFAGLTVAFLGASVTVAVSIVSVVELTNLVPFLPLTTLLDSKDEETARIASSVPTVFADAEVLGNCPFVALDFLVLVEEDVSNSLA